MKSLHRRTAHTLLVIDNNRIARIDVAGIRRLRIQSVAQEVLADSMELIDSIRRAIHLSPNRPGRISVISERFWTDLISLPKDVVSIASSDELRLSLAVEAEIETGIAPLESIIACCKLSELDHQQVDFCVTQVSHSQLQSCEELARSVRSKLFSLSHPIALDSSSDSLIDADYVRRALANWQSDDSTRLDDLAESWIKTISSKRKKHEYSINSLMIRVNAQLSPMAKRAIGIALICLTCAGCWLRFHLQSEKLAGLNQRIAIFDQRAAEHAASESSTKKLESKLASLRKSHAELQQQVSHSEIQNRNTKRLQHLRHRRWPSLIEACSGCPSGCWIQQIEPVENGVSFRGISVDLSATQLFAVELEQRLQGCGWRFTPITTEQLAGGLQKFCITLLIDDTDYTFATPGIAAVQTQELMDGHCALALRPTP